VCARSADRFHTTVHSACGQLARSNPQQLAPFVELDRQVVTGQGLTADDPAEIEREIRETGRAA
jgi:hypothetical protein